MGGTAATRSRRRYRRARRLCSEKRGVVAVIGTLLALLVFFALFGIFLTQYVPLWMTDNEAQFSNQAATSFAQFKGSIDTQYELGLPPSIGTPFTISSGSVPLIAQPTEAILSFLPQTCPGGFIVKGAGAGQPVNPAYCIFQNQTLSTGPGGSAALHLSAATGVLQMQLPNRYYSGQTFYYEDDGVIQVQSLGHQIMAYAPPFNVTRIGGNATTHLGGNTTISSSFLQLYGNATTVVGQGTEEVYSELRYAQPLTSNGKAVSSTNSTLQPFNYTFELGTQYPCAWSTFLGAQMNSSGVPYAATPTPGHTSYNFTTTAAPHGTNVAYTGTCYNPTSATTVIILNVYSVNYANLFYAGVEVQIGIGGV
ncbi:MAG: hypothetical protein WBW47_08235 [Thermoplasmata archaeon]